HEEDVTLRAPVVGLVARAVDDEAHADLTELARPPESEARLAVVACRLDVLPLGRDEVEALDLHLRPIAHLRPPRAEFSRKQRKIGVMVGLATTGIGAREGLRSRIARELGASAIGTTIAPRTP